MKSLLDEWNELYNETEQFKVIYCVGSRWNNIHMAANRKAEYKPPPLPINYEQLKHKELGWINESIIQKYSYTAAIDTKVIVCGLPGVYDKICRPRFETELTENCALYNLGYTNDMVIKL